MLRAMGFATFAVLLVVLCSTQAFASIDCASKRAALNSAFIKIKAEFQKNRDADKIPGIAFSVFDKECELYSDAVGVSDLEANSPMVAGESILRIASVSKLFTDLAITTLIEKGDLDWNTKIMDLKDVEFVKFILANEMDQERIKKWRQITIGSLMSHQSGLSKDLPGSLVFFNIDAIEDHAYPSLAALYRGINQVEFIYNVGEVSPGIKYSNLGVNLLGHIVGVDYVLNSMLAPLNTKDTYYDVGKGRRNSMASTYGGLDANGNRPKMPKVFKVGSYAGSIGVATTASDLGKLGREMLKMTLFEKNNLVNKSAVIRELFFARNALERIEAYGHGPAWTHLPDETMDQPLWVGHVGTGYGERAIMMVSPERNLGFSILFNTKQANRQKYGKIISEALMSQANSNVPEGTKELLKAAREVLSGAPITYENVAGESVSESDLKRYVGKYNADNFGDIEASIENGELKMFGLRLISENHKEGKFRFIRSTDFLFNGEPAIFGFDKYGTVLSVRLANSKIFYKVQR